jgi:hypothetical protein
MIVAAYSLVNETSPKVSEPIFAPLRLIDIKVVSSKSCSKV